MICQGLFQIFMACLGHPALLTPRGNLTETITRMPWRLPDFLSCHNVSFLLPTFLFSSWLPSWSLRNRCPVSFPKPPCLHSRPHSLLCSPSSPHISRTPPLSIRLTLSCCKHSLLPLSKSSDAPFLPEFLPISRIFLKEQSTWVLFYFIPSLCSLVHNQHAAKAAVVRPPILFLITQTSDPLSVIIPTTILTDTFSCPGFHSSTISLELCQSHPYCIAKRICSWTFCILNDLSCSLCSSQENWVGQILSPDAW